MPTPSRRTFLKRTTTLAAATLAAATLSAPALSRAADAPIRTPNPRDIRIENISVAFTDLPYRTPLKFARALVDRQTMQTVTAAVRTTAGHPATGFGTLPLNYVFTFPSQRLSDADRLAAMKALAEELAKVTAAYNQPGHPIEIHTDLFPAYLQAAADVSRRLQLADPIPKLCTLVTAAAVDAALHDAYGKAHARSAFHTYAPGFMNHDLSRYLGLDFRNEYPERYIRPDPAPRMPLCHLVGAVDPLTPAEVTKPLRDGLPESLVDWIHYNGLNHLKIKLNGNDLEWDLARMISIDRVTSETQKKRSVTDWAYVPDFNEKCPDAAYYLAFLRQLKERAPAAFARIEYVEQPTSRDLARPGNDMHAAARLRPVVIDESLTDVDSLEQARRAGWTGAVIKSPKGLTNMLLIACAAGKQKTFTAGGDMSCPGAALVQTASLQARVPGITSVEANARQYLPAANKVYEPRFPGMFRVTDGMLKTAELTGPGLSA